MKKFGKLEKKYVLDALDSGNLFYNGGKKTEKLVSVIKKQFGVKYAATMSSGTAALHCAVGACKIPPGNEVITSPITDMGTLIGVLYQNLIPVFADVDPHTYNITAESIEKVITDKTKAIIIVHLAGNPAEMDEIMQLAKEKNLKVIEDCAQSYGALYKGKPIGTIGDIGCYSLNSYKHINCGDGGFIITNDKDLYNTSHNYADKFYDRNNTGTRLTMLGPNYRITELQSAVALAQFKKVDTITSTREKLGNKFNQGIKDLPGISPHKVYDHNDGSYWFTMIRIKPEELDCDRKTIVNTLKAKSIGASEGYISVPIYLEPVFRNKNFFPGGIWPAEIVSGKDYEYKEGLCPIAEEVLKTAIRIPIDESMDEQKIDKMIEVVKSISKKHSKI